MPRPQENAPLILKALRNAGEQGLTEKEIYIHTRKNTSSMYKALRALTNDKVITQMNGRYFIGSPSAIMDEIKNELPISLTEGALISDLMHVYLSSPKDTLEGITKELNNGQYRVGNYRASFFDRLAIFLIMEGYYADVDNIKAITQEQSTNASQTLKRITDMYRKKDALTMPTVEEVEQSQIPLQPTPEELAEQAKQRAENEAKRKEELEENRKRELRKQRSYLDTVINAGDTKVDYQKVDLLVRNIIEKDNTGRFFTMEGNRIDLYNYY